jgi:hypothetical protein
MSNINIPLGTGTWIQADHRGAHGGVIIGGPGSGKSALIKHLAKGCRAEVWHAAPHGIDPLPGAAQVALGSRDCEKLLARAGRLLTSRQSVPVLLILEDPHWFFQESEAATETAWRIARAGRKLGVSLIVTTQTSTVDAFGRSSALREALTGGNVVQLRTSTLGSLERLGLRGVKIDVDLSRLARPGEGYIKPAGADRFTHFRFGPA